MRPTAQIAVVAPALIALAVRLYGLGAEPLWLDEVITHNRGLMPFSELVADSLINKHFPTYFILARAFDAPLIDEGLLRLPSAVFGSLAVLLVTIIATELRSPRAGLAAGLIMALSPIDVQFSQEARSYALVACLTLLALWGLLRIIRDLPTRDAPLPEPASATRAAWIAYGIGTLAALYVLLVAAVWWLAANLAFLIVALRAGAKRTLARWFTVQAVIALVFLPGLVVLLRAGGGDPLRGYKWIPASTWQHVSNVLSSVYLYRASNLTNFELLPTPVPWLGVIVLAFALFGLWQLRASRQLVPLGLAWLLMPVVMLIVSNFHTVWIPRYLLWTTGAFYVLAGIGVAALPRRLFAWTLAFLIVGGVGNLAPYYRSETKPRWDLAADYLAAHARARDSIVARDYQAYYVLSAYAARAHLALPVINGADIAQTAAALPPRGQVWLLYGRTGQSAVTPEDVYLRKWAMLGAPAEMVRFGRNVLAWRFERGGH